MEIRTIFDHGHWLHNRSGFEKENIKILFSVKILFSNFQTVKAVVNSAGLFMIGGSDDFGPVSFVQYFDQDAKVWTLWEELPVPIGISASSAVNVNDDIYLIGGNGNEANILQLDLGTQQWFNTTNLEHVSFDGMTLFGLNLKFKLGTRIILGSYWC